MRELRAGPAEEAPAERYPLRLTTGRTLYHFHTRTKTARAPQLAAAAPEVWVELSRTDADSLEVSEGDLVEVRSPRGAVRGAARISGIREGVVFVPFHYGHWDLEDESAPGDGASGRQRAANELTITDWDPASKQPLYKVGSVAVRKLADADGPAPAPTVGASAPLDALPPTEGGEPAQASERLEVTP